MRQFRIVGLSLDVGTLIIFNSLGHLRGFLVWGWFGVLRGWCKKQDLVCEFLQQSFRGKKALMSCIGSSAGKGWLLLLGYSKTKAKVPKCDLMEGAAPPVRLA